MSVHDQIIPIAYPEHVDTEATINEWIADIRRPMRDAEPRTPLGATVGEKGREFLVHRSFVGPDPCGKDYGSEALSVAVQATPEYRKAMRSAINALACDLHAYFMLQGGEIVWRCRPGFDIQFAHVLVTVAPVGPDKCYGTDQRGWMDKRFWRACGYADVLCAPAAGWDQLRWVHK